MLRAILTPNTVIPQETGRCEFFQIPPRINQDVHWNGCHLVPSASGYHPGNDWEKPVICIIIINYIDKSLQVFAADGEFAAEYVLSGSEGGSGVRLRPFPPTPASDERMAAFLQHEYLKEIYSMIEMATGNLPHAPETYADALSAVLGRPIASTYAGRSLELATPPYATHAFTDAKKQVQSVLDYDFPLKLGDKDAAYDGLIGYFPVQSSTPDEIAMSKIKTHFAAMTDNTTSSPDSLSQQHNAALSIFGMFVDIFTPVMGYSGILPVKQLKLPA
ncbi:hypothetical protein Slin15195_G051980 [Septoria linicola]|uniref:Uncharacterized protein n=1 Tax=Septoria linicola TaxID=215465 RepID=A0A9Q9AP77_9PEZI|nr:hypothetical protein Slin14017_G127490 [Septoria linicola]USW51879.1 hypothetical protein Slin15195_G051980 [Septoria linicola]